LRKEERQTDGKTDRQRQNKCKVCETERKMREKKEKSEQIRVCERQRVEERMFKKVQHYVKERERARNAGERTKD
jgi:hypothetical protein